MFSNFQKSIFSPEVILASYSWYFYLVFGSMSFLFLLPLPPQTLPPPFSPIPWRQEISDGRLMVYSSAFPPICHQERVPWSYFSPSLTETLKLARQVQSRGWCESCKVKNCKKFYDHLKLKYLFGRGTYIKNVSLFLSGRLQKKHYFFFETPYPHYLGM